MGKPIYLNYTISMHIATEIENVGNAKKINVIFNSTYLFATVNSKKMVTLNIFLQLTRKFEKGKNILLFHPVGVMVFQFFYSNISSDLNQYYTIPNNG